MVINTLLPNTPQQEEPRALPVAATARELLPGGKLNAFEQEHSILCPACLLSFRNQGWSEVPSPAFSSAKSSCQLEFCQPQSGKLALANQLKYKGPGKGAWQREQVKRGLAKGLFHSILKVRLHDIPANDLSRHLRAMTLKNATYCDGLRP